MNRPSYCKCPGPHLSAPECGTSPTRPEGICDPNYAWRRAFDPPTLSVDHPEDRRILEQPRPGTGDDR